MELLEKVRNAGVIGAGGAGFPTHVKLEADADYILLNGAECEPLLRVDQQLMAMYPAEIVKGLELAGRQVGAPQAVIGIKGKHKKVIDILNCKIQELALDDYMRVGILPDMYPAGDEQVLVYELTHRVVPEVGIPIAVGCVVVNAETALNIYKASLDEAVTEKYITLAGDIPNRMTVKAPIGIPVRDVLKMSGIDDFSDYAVIDGGPMMGSVMTDTDGFITKKNKGFVILKKDHPLILKKSCTMEQAGRINRSTCEQCRMCTDLCPRYLLGHQMEPHKMMRVGNYKMDAFSGQMNAQLCCQCNLCELFSCPAGLHPRMMNLYLKDQTIKQNLRYKPNKTEFAARDARDYRKVPSKRLIARLGLAGFDYPAPVTDVDYNADRIHIALSQHVGAPAEPIVAVGDSVKAGQMIGRIPEGKLSAAVHSSIDGKVLEMNQKYIVVGR